MRVEQGLWEESFSRLYLSPLLYPCLLERVVPCSDSFFFFFFGGDSSPVCFKVPAVRLTLRLAPLLILILLASRGPI